MKLKEIFNLATETSDGLTVAEFFGDFLDSYATVFKIKNRFGQNYSLDSSRLSEYFSSDTLPDPFIKAVSENGFEENILKMTSTLFYIFRKKLRKAKLLEAINGYMRNNRLESKADGNAEAEVQFAILITEWLRAKNEERLRELTMARHLRPHPSIFAKIISFLASQPIDDGRSIKLPRPYTIEEKMNANEIEGELRFKIGNLFDAYYGAIDEAIEALGKSDPTIRSKFLNKIRYFYLEFFSCRALNPEDEVCVKANAAESFSYCEGKIHFYIQSIEIENVYEEYLDDYVSACVTYAFYKCRILLKARNENANQL